MDSETTKENKMKNEKATIRKSNKPCGCGCGGADSWHKQTFIRTIRNIKEETGRTMVSAFGIKRQTRRSGLAQFPWGKTKVVEVVVAFEKDGKPAQHVCGWYVVDHWFDMSDKVVWEGK